MCKIVISVRYYTPIWRKNHLNFTKGVKINKWGVTVHTPLQNSIAAGNLE